ncbi:response regulator transcription factor [Microbacterium sp. NC79]|uniref:response regulator transcription factor n=1 Tax=Microbacterium sp. NC79 TaxID=2851009 RepID=UPI001C2CAC2E|nr:response regulator transcription factor [Microbacterium sp. NC79]MBV0895014.1 response regulator transcription factor [Microbacterium sp. NC79]
MRIVICEDAVLLREGLVRLLEDAGHTVVAALPDAHSLMATLATMTADLLILDVRLPPSFTDEGIRAALAVRAANPQMAILVLSQYVEERYATELITANSAGLGYLLKDRVADVNEFLESAESVAGGATVLDPEVVAQLLSRRRRDSRLERLTDRERDVLALMAQGKSNSAIAEALFISEGSVEKHISALFTKLDLETSASDNRRVLAVLTHLGADSGV